MSKNITLGKTYEKFCFIEWLEEISTHFTLGAFVDVAAF